MLTDMVLSALVVAALVVLFVRVRMPRRRYGEVYVYQCFRCRFRFIDHRLPLVQQVIEEHRGRCPRHR